MRSLRGALAIALVLAAGACQTSPQGALADVDSLSAQLCSVVDAYYRDRASNASQDQISADYGAMWNQKELLGDALDATAGLSADVKRAWGELDLSVTQPKLYDAAADCRAFQQAWGAQ